MLKSERILVAITLCLLSASSFAGCIGPVIMGKCKGTVVPYDTHLPGPSQPQAGYGFYFDKRGTQYDRDNPGVVNPFNGQDPHDANQRLYEKQQAIERACQKLRLRGQIPLECL